MKKIIGIVIASLVFCNVGFAEMRLIEEKRIDGKIYNNWITTVCIDDYKFVFMRAGDFYKGDRAQSQSIVQFYEVGGTSPNKYMALPAKC